MSRPTSCTLRRLVVITVMAAALIPMLACTTVGTGRGRLEPGDAPVTFAWTSNDGGTTGTMTASIGKTGQSGAAGGAFTGAFLQVTSSIRTDSFEPMWNGWGRGWNDWGYLGYWGRFPETAFTTHYTGKVVANLQGPGAQRLRCSFHLNTPSAGMGGGGQGECQFNGGRTVDAVFPRC